MSSVETQPSAPIYSTIIAGGGPGGLGPLLWAAQKGCLEEWLDRGIALVESSARLGGRLGGYGINSDSLGGSYLECLDAEALVPALHCLRADPVTEKMREYRDRFPPLPLVDRYMARMGEALAAMISARERCGLYLTTTVEDLHLREDGTIAAHVRQGATATTLVARSAIVAVGGRQLCGEQELTRSLTLSDCSPRHLLTSDQLLTHQGLAEAASIVRGADGRRIVILGGSHSAYAVAWALLALPDAESLVDGQLAILQRRAPRVFYPDRAAAEADCYAVAPGDICPRTGRVNRMGGLRGHGREIWRRIARRPDVLAEARVAIHPLQDYSAAALRAEIEQAALVVPCFGYRAATLPVFNPAGERASDWPRTTISMPSARHATFFAPTASRCRTSSASASAPAIGRARTWDANRTLTARRTVCGSIRTTSAA